MGGALKTPAPLEGDAGGALNESEQRKCVGVDQTPASSGVRVFVLITGKSIVGSETWLR